MKKFLLVLLFGAGVVTASSAQEGFGWGVKGGLNITGITNLPGNTVSKAGFTLGAFVDYRFSQHFAVSADALYSRQGVIHKVGGDGEYRYKTRLNYLNIPILANYYVLDGLAVKAGIQPGFLLSAKNVVKHDNLTTKEDISSEVHGADFAIPIGVSYECPFGFIVEARYNIGVSNVASSGGTARNSVFSLMVGYRF